MTVATALPRPTAKFLDASGLNEDRLGDGQGTGICAKLTATVRSTTVPMMTANPIDGTPVARSVVGKGQDTVLVAG